MIKCIKSFDFVGISMVTITAILVISMLFAMFMAVNSMEDPQFKKVFAESYAKCTSIKYTNNDSCLRLARDAAYMSIRNK